MEMESDVKRVWQCTIGRTFIGRGCQRHPNCLAWSKSINLVVFASDGDICFVVPKGNYRCMAIECTVNAHNSSITCLKFVSWSYSKAPGLDYLITGAADGSVRLWAIRWSSVSVVTKLIDDIGYATGRSVSCCAGEAICESSQDIIIVAYSIPDSPLIAEQVIVRRESMDKKIRQSYERISIQPAFIVSLAVHTISNEDTLFMLGTTDNNIHVVCAKFAPTSSCLIKAVTLRGHTDWICAIDVRACGNDILVASGGQDNVIRIWHFAVCHGEGKFIDNDSELKTISFALFNEKTEPASGMVHITLQGVLDAHDDWVYSVEWHPNKMQLLSASNDKTVVIWEPAEVAAGLWLDKVRVGDVGGQAVGFFGACFSPDGSTILAYSYFGGFCSWQLEENTNWKSVSTFGGHSGQVKDISWDPTGSYLLSCSFDQTTRCYAPFREHVSSSISGVVGEIARPQIHGYNLTCISSISSSCFVSGADEKILRVFTVPRKFVEMLGTLSKCNCQELFPDVAQIAEHSATVPALGLSNKMSDGVDIQDDKNLAADDRMNRCGTANWGSGLPVEEYLMQNTLWPEIQKLYGHGYEVFTVASNHCGTTVASACKASHTESAAVIIWDSDQWRRRCELLCHKLTVVQLVFSNNDAYLLSVSRDRTFAISARSSQDPYDWKVQLTSEQKYSKVHSRIIWCCAWSPDDKYFVTGARDKKLCIWHFDGNDIELVAEKKHSYAVTAVDFIPKLWNKHYVLALGFENGEVEIEKWNSDDNGISDNGTCLKRWSAHSKIINKLRFRPKEGSWLDIDTNDRIWELASASDDSSVIVHHLVLS